MRTVGESCCWSKAVWFSQATPKYAFMTWLAVRDRLSTMDRVSKWRQGVDEVCVLRKNAPETRNHLFYECPYSSQILEYQTSGILLSAQTNVWPEVLAHYG